MRVDWEQEQFKFCLRLLSGRSAFFEPYFYGFPRPESDLQFNYFHLAFCSFCYYFHHHSGRPLTGTLKYGFQSALNAGRASLFGQTDVTESDLQGLVIGANNPKPAKATKKLATGYESSFCDFSQWAALEQQGYNVTAPKKSIRLPRTTSLSTTMYVTINGIKYAWQMPLVVGSVGNVSAVGAKSAPAGATDLVFGASFPKPPRYQYVNTSTGDRLNIFGDPSTSEATAATAGWVQTFTGRHTQQDLALLLG